MNAAPSAQAHEVEARVKRMVHFSTRALIFLTLAWAFLTIGVFTFNPVSPAGIACLCIGLPLVAISISYFVRYWAVSRKIKQQIRGESHP